MILTDAGPLVALIDLGESDHLRCVAALESLRGPMLTTWPAFTEAMYLLGEAAAWHGQEPLWRMVDRGHLQIAHTTAGMLERMPVLMGKYHDLPMDLADASLVALAEEKSVNRIFTLDSDFTLYRLPGRKRFTLVPAPR
ncbi:MAG TPA: PIN domain-containing protein [Candidatus Xenobia bacterium]